MDGDFSGLTLGTSGSWRILLGGWRTILDDLKQVKHTIQRTPTSCACSPTCGCCAESRSEGSRPHCVKCERQGQALSTEIDRLLVDMLRFYPVFDEIVRPRLPDRERYRLDDLHQRVDRLEDVMRHVRGEWPEYLHGCRTPQLTHVTRLAQTVIDAATALDRFVEAIPDSARST